MVPKPGGAVGLFPTNGHRVRLQDVRGTLQFWPNMLQKREPRRQPCLVGYPLRLPSKLGIIGTTC